MNLDNMHPIAFQHIPKLPSYLGAAKQVSWVVTDIDKAIAHWQDQHSVGPFLVARDEMPLKNAYYRGDKAEDVRLNIAFAYVEGYQLELTQLIGNTPSMYQEAIDRELSGVHHYAVCVDDFAQSYQQLLHAGYEAVVDSGVDGLARMSYLEHPAENFILEVIEWNALTKPYFDELKRRWQQADPQQSMHEFNLSELMPLDAVIAQLGRFLLNKLSGKVVKTLPS